MGSASVLIKGPGTNGCGNSVAAIDCYMGMLGQGDFEWFSVSMGVFYGTGRFEINVGDQATFNTLIKIGSDTNLLQAVSLGGSWSSGGNSLLTVYENPTVIIDGSLLPSVAVNRVHSEDSLTEAFSDPTVTSDGNQVYKGFIPGGTGGNAGGGSSGPFSRILTSPGSSYLVRVQNIAGNPQPINLSLNWAEIPKKWNQT